jgi:hypothetical protein
MGAVLEIVSAANSGIFSLSLNSAKKLSPRPGKQGKHTKNHGTSQFFMGKLTISMAAFNSYVSLPEGSAKLQLPGN